MNIDRIVSSLTRGNLLENLFGKNSLTASQFNKLYLPQAHILGAVQISSDRFTGREGVALFHWEQESGKLFFAGRPAS